MFEAKRAVKIHEEIQLGDEVITINLSPYDMWKDYRKAEAAVVLAQDEVRKAHAIVNGKGGATAEAKQAAIDALGAAVIQLFNVIFGEENTAKILAFYDNNYPEMLSMLVPFIMDTIKPRIEQGVKEMSENSRYAYKRGKYGKKFDGFAGLVRGK